MTPQPLLITLVSVQFLIHSLIWAMAARLAHRWSSAEGHFALFWLLLACGLMLFVPPWESGSLPRNAADLLIIAAMAAQHRGLAVHWGLRPRWQGYAGLMAASVGVIALSFLSERGHGMRVAVVCLAASLMFLTSVSLIWRHGRSTSVAFARVTSGGYALLAVVLLGRGVQALVVSPGVKISIDAPGHANIPFAIVVLFVGGLLNLSHIRLVLGRVLTRLSLQAKTDELTGALNRRGLQQQLEALHAEAAQGLPGYAVLMVDVDHFKAINDRHGHAEGDRVLRQVSASLSAALRSGDLVGRWGGEEFCIALPRTQLKDALQLAERVAAQVSASASAAIPVTVSIGVASAASADTDLQAVIRRADEALYKAKQAGRNRVVTAAAPSPEQR